MIYIINNSILDLCYIYSTPTETVLVTLRSYACF